MTRTMGDSTTIESIPRNQVQIVAAYINGHEGNIPPSLMEDLFPNSKYGHVFIDVIGDRADVQVRDWENGDKGGNLEQWVIDHNNHTGKKDAVIYCNRSTVPEVRRLTGSQILGKDYWLWIATGDGTIVQGNGIIACQNKWSGMTGAHWDSSIVFDDTFWLPVGKPTPPPAPKPPSPKISCTPLQRAVRTYLDGIWGPETEKHCNALIKAWDHEFPYGVRFAQKVVGTRVDGSWGPNSNRSMRDTTAHSQRALTAMGFYPGKVDGIWGDHTQNAYDLARKACHI